MNAVVCMTTLLVAAMAAEEPEARAFRLRILHTNDLHSRIEQISQTAGKCSEEEAARNRCYGGFARLQGAIEQEIRKAERENVSVLSLNAGDTYQGTVWYSMFTWKVVVQFLNMLTIDAMSLGNHEFDDGIKGLTPFLHESKIPVLAANIDSSEEPDFLATPLIKTLTVKRGGREIGIIGYVTPETVTVAYTGKLKFLDEIETLTEEARKLKNNGVDIIIALGHSGYEMDIEIGKKVPDVDVVVGGHSHTFLYTGPPPDSDIPVDTYPVMVYQSTGRKVAMVQAYGFTKYLGKIDLWFDEKGELTKAEGNPILLNHEIPEDPAVLEEVDVWTQNISLTLKEQIGSTKVFLDGGSCRFYECNLGNLITDSYIHYGVKNHFGMFWAEAAIAIQQSGGIRASINATASNGKITREDLITVSPFFSPVSIIRIQGRYLLEALEWSVYRYDLQHKVGRGEFLQMSGIRVTYDLTKPPGSRVVSVKVRCSDCYIPNFYNLDVEEHYNIIMPTFIFEGGDNFHMIKNYGKQIIQYELKETEMFINYIREKKLVYNGLDDRIQMIEV